MRIRFKKGDPRAGMVVQPDSIRGQELVDAGAAEVVSESDLLETEKPMEQPEHDEPHKPKTKRKRADS